ncbi:MAG TPA: PH domain-containing protein, partial [Bacillota bacterium]
MASTRGDAATFVPVKVRTPWFTALLALIAVVALLPPAFYGYEAYGFSRFEYRVSPDGVRVRYGLVDLRLPAEEIATVTVVEDPGRLSRVAGTGLPEVQRGWWNSSEYGRVYRLTTTRRDLVLIETTPDASAARPATRYLLSPSDPGEFTRLVEAVRRGEAAAAGLPPEGRSFPPA